ncbi:hypothetical protein IW261DRAFT_1595427 [Armillaria novae-zelandiae]|uniref:DUF6534 domain-containing protein n=1 Tax=Armillaria novae-zelandiae TaxID=153914 RepID=A0AA39P0T1_9AGAR|nr:hypothetical protein IW261DRAFT_1595427 [Armillaria novae-zelandiae]
MPSLFATEAGPDLPSLGPTMGVMFLGETIALILYGTSILQTAIYFKEYPNDWWFYRLSIAVLWVLDTLHIAFTTHSLYFYAIDSFGDYLTLLKLVWSFKLALFLYNMIVLCVHIIYCVRLWMLGRYFHSAVPWFITVIVAGICAASIVFCRDVYAISYIIEIDKISLTIEAGLITTATVDIVISFAMTYYLLRARAVSTNFFSTHIRLEALMRLVLISGLGTSALVIASLITFLVLRGTLVFLSIGVIVPKLYINSLLAMFNARKRRWQESLGSVSMASRSRVPGDETNFAGIGNPNKSSTKIRIGTIVQGQEARKVGVAAKEKIVTHDE